MGTRYAAIAEAARMHSLPDDEKIQYFRNMITEEKRLDIGGAYYEDGFNDGIAKGREEGKAEGKAEGRAEERKTIAKNLLTMNYPVESIARVTGLTPEEITAL